jgi:serine/threonine protein kinase/tetratricopeptide (TPR) repeat protein
MDEALALSTFGPYRLEARIGGGGMGVVYRGRHTTSGRAVALKTIRTRSAELVAALRREVQVLAGLSHPGIVHVLDQGLTDGTPWYAMELVEGRPLSSLLHGPTHTTAQLALGRLRSTAPLLDEEQLTPGFSLPDSVPEASDYRPPLNELLSVMRKVCAALGFLHSHGLVHRDLKPANILIQKNGNPVLVDFGLVGQFRDASGREVLEVAASAGTLAYMAPEQALGSLVDARADLFSLGCILYECIVGEHPFPRGGPHDTSVEPPPAPSTRVASVSAELDALVMGLLTRDVRDRVGYADDVAVALDRITQARPLPSPGSTQRVYLYRPEFAGRRELLERLCGFVNDAKVDAGSITLLSGESGLGKTRLLLELCARALASGTRVITGECRPARAVSLDETRGEPLHPFRNFLVALADYCRAGGPELSKRLLGEHGAVLAAYEPTLVTLLGPDRSAPERESPDRAPARVFRALAEVLGAFSEQRPLLLLLDDLQWADSLSLEFLSAFAEHLSLRRRVTIVGTFRSEEMREELGALCRRRGVEVQSLERFDSVAVGQMVSGMLALRTAPEEWVTFLEQESGGNPFFIAEYLRAAIAERLLTRTQAGRWTMGEDETDTTLRERLRLPATISALVGRRLSSLEPESLQLVWAAAVLGREFDEELVAETAGIELARVTDAYGRLRQRQILQDETSGASGFVHDKLREVAYSLIGTEERRRLHQRAAEALARRQESGASSVEAGTLGYHYAQAGNHQRAAHYFGQAGEAARRNHANRDALRYLRLALGELEHTELRDQREHRVASARLREAIADVLFVFGQMDEARAALERAITDTPAADRLARARRRRLMARTWERLHDHERALALCAQAAQDLGEPPDATGSVDDYWFEWVQIQIQTTGHLYFLNKVAELQAVLEHVRPLVEQRGSPQQRTQFLQGLIQANLRGRRYRGNAESVELARASLRAAQQTHDLSELALARGFLGVVLTMTDAGDAQEAEEMFTQAIAQVERVGDAGLSARFLTYYGVLLRRSGRVGEVQSLAQRALDIATKHGFHDYVGVAHANLAWVALRTGGDVEAVAGEALTAWGRLPAAYVYPLQWTLRVPLAIHLTRLGKLDEAKMQWELLLDIRQHLLPDELTRAIQLALEESSTEVSAQRARLDAIATLTRDLHYA